MVFNYRDLEEMMKERGVSVDHTTIYRWVIKYSYELKKGRGNELLQLSLFSANL